MLAVVDAREMQARTHVLHIPIQHLDVRELKRHFELFEELVAGVAAPYGTQCVVGRKWNLRQPFHGFLDPRSKVWRGFLELDVFHDQVHCPLVDKVVNDSGNTWCI